MSRQNAPWQPHDKESVSSEPTSEGADSREMFPPRLVAVTASQFGIRPFSDRPMFESVFSLGVPANLTNDAFGKA